MNIPNLDVNKIAAAIEADAGQAIDGLRQALQQAKDGVFAATHTPEIITARRARGRPFGSVKAEKLKPVSLRLDEATLAALRASGKGWQSRAAKVLAQYVETADANSNT